MLSLREPRNGRLVTITGPVRSGKTTHLEQLLNSASVIWDKGPQSNILLAKHPYDDVKSPGKVAGYDALETSSPDEIASHVTPNTEAVIISGINFYEDKSIVNLLQDLVLRNRRVYVAGHALDWDANPFPNMPAIMALSDDFIITNAPCMVDGCQLQATRSQKVDGESMRVCTKHHSFEGRPDHRHYLIDQIGGFEGFVGSMYASKTTVWRQKMKELSANKIDYEVFKWINDKRYSERNKQYKLYDVGFIGFNNSEEKIPAVYIRTAEDVVRYIDGNTGIREIDEKSARRRLGHIFIDEGQFIDGLAGVVRARVYQGYKFYITGLLRTAKMEPFGEIPKLLVLADSIDVMHGYCERCGREASESQKFTKIGDEWIPSDYYEDPIRPGGKEDSEEVVDKYEARCRHCIEIPNRPEPKYRFERYYPKVSLR
jgi:thymidine kinase